MASRGQLLQHASPGRSPARNWASAGAAGQGKGVLEDLQDQPLSDADAIWFTDGSSFLHQGQRYAGAAVTSETKVVWAEAQPSPPTSAHEAELIALTQALKLGRDRKLTVYTDS